MKKLTNFLLLILSLFILNGIVVSGANEYVTTGNAGYRVIEREQTNDLSFGVSHFMDISETQRDGFTFAQEVNVLEVPASSKAKIISYGNLSNHKWTLTTVSGLARQFEDENPDWKVLAAVNGDFFDINARGNLPYQTNNPLVTNGEYYKTGGSNAIGFKKEGSVNTLVGGIPTRTQYMVLSVYDDNDQIINEFDVQKLNTTPGVNETAVYFGTYGSDKQYVPKVVDAQANRFVVEAAELALPNSANDFYGKGVISTKDAITLQIGQFAILSNNTEVLGALNVGVKIRVQYKLTGELEGATDVTGHNGKFVVDNEFSNVGLAGNLSERHPRTVAGIKADGTLVLSVIDGRAPATGKNGMFGNEMAAFMKSLGVEEAYNLDGGGSSVMVVKENGEFVVKSSPSDGRERSDGNALLVAVQVPNIDIDIERTTDSLNFTLDVKDTNGYELKDIYVKVGDFSNKVVNGKAEFIGLEADTSYYYELLYKNNSNRIASLMINGNLKTLKEEPIFKYIKIEETDLLYKISVEYSDTNNASNIKTAKLIVNGENKTLQNGELLYLKSSFKDTFKTFDISYSYNDNLETHEVNIVNAPYRILTSPVTETLYEMFRTHNEAILKIYS